MEKIFMMKIGFVLPLIFLCALGTDAARTIQEAKASEASSSSSSSGSKKGSEGKDVAKGNKKDGGQHALPGGLIKYQIATSLCCNPQDAFYKVEESSWEGQSPLQSPKKCSTYLDILLWSL